MTKKEPYRPGADCAADLKRIDDAQRKERRVHVRKKSASPSLTVAAETTIEINVDADRLVFTNATKRALRIETGELEHKRPGGEARWVGVHDDYAAIPSGMAMEFLSAAERELIFALRSVPLPSKENVTRSEGGVPDWYEDLGRVTVAEGREGHSAEGNNWGDRVWTAFLDLRDERLKNGGPR